MSTGRLRRFMALRHHYSLFYMMERLLKIIENDDLEEHMEELFALHYWLRVDRFNRKAVNKRLYDHAHGENVFMWV